ncbi:3'-5' exonuclease [Ramlibacter sp. AN1015]|uniref:3'-5' exonuclease n=1 Tax=Ramlibacter sp. AN1015 TaxID=3133428 RepID=UPI0030C3438A
MSWWRWPGRRAPTPEGAEARWLVLDVEATGLDPHRAELLAIAAVGLRCDWRTRRLALCPGDSFSVRLRPSRPGSRENVLVHGIGLGAQDRAAQPRDALQAFLQFAQGAPLLAFHADFDRTLLQRQVRAQGGRRMAHAWLDIAHLCTSAFPSVRARSLDDWLGHFGITCLARHEAEADVLAESELLQRVWPRVAAECGSWDALQAYASRHAWLRQP